jgi:hypothetical protein
VGYFCKFQKKLAQSKKSLNGENSPNLVTLLGSRHIEGCETKEAIFNEILLRRKNGKNSPRTGLPDCTHIFKPKIAIWENFGWALNSKSLLLCMAGKMALRTGLPYIWYIYFQT